MTDDWLDRREVLAALPPPMGGAYVLEFELRSPLRVRAGRLGIVEIPAGRVRYYGSAWGPGGLRARVSRHLRGPNRRHWHVDALTRRVRPSRVLLVPGGNECELVTADLATGGWTVPVRGFGATDCRRCTAHMLHRALR